jgi:tetratricopeptide (TPR) repeat protein
MLCPLLAAPAVAPEKAAANIAAPVKPAAAQPAAPSPSPAAVVEAPPPMAAVPVAPPVTVKEALALSADALDELVFLNNRVSDQYFETGQWEKAVDMLERVIELDATSIDSYSNAAWLLWSSGKTEEALRFCQRMVDDNPHDMNAAFEYGFFLFRVKRYADALPWFKKAVDLGIEPPRRHMYGNVLELLGRRDEALKFWQDVLAQHPDSDVAKKHIERLNTPEVPAPNKP